MIKIAIFTLASLGTISFIAQADTVQTNFTAGVTSGTNQKETASVTFTLGSSSITATAGVYTYNPPTSPLSASPVTLDPPNNNVVIVNDRTGYSGLGVCGSLCGNTGSGYNTSEIDIGNSTTTHELLQLNLSSAEAAGYAAFAFGSSDAIVDNGIEEELGVYGTDNSGQLGTFLGDVDDADGIVIIPTAQQYTYINIISDMATGDANNGNGNVLLSLVQASTPEPSTVALLALGLVGCGWFTRRRRAGN